MIDVRRLRYLAVLIEQGSFRRAARLLGMSQPALTLAIQKLEEEVGERLIDRLPSGLETTVAGDLILERSRPILQDMARLESELRDLKGLRRGALAIGVGPGLNYAAVAAAVQELAKSGIRCAIRTGQTGEMLTPLRGREVDLLIGRVVPDAMPDDVVATKLFDDRYVIVMGPDHPLAAAAAYDRATGPAQQWLFNGAMSDAAQSAARFLGLESGTGVQGVGVLVNREMTLELLASGSYLSAWPLHAFWRELNEGRLVSLDIPPVDGERWLCRMGVIQVAGRTRSLAARRFVDVLRRELAARMTQS